VGPNEFGRDDALAFLAAVYAATPPAPPLPPGALDEIMLVHGWLQRHRAAINVVPLAAPAGDGARATAADLAAVADTLLARLALCST
jgi:hypothetical protein